MLLNSQTEQKSRSKVVSDLTKNVKQQEFLYEVFKTIHPSISDKRYFFYGGGVRGGKTFICLTILILLAKKYPKSRWHIIRDSFTTLEETTIPSLEKICPETTTTKWYRNKSNYHLAFPNGAKIYLVSESYYQDPSLHWMDGLETNGIFLEQLEGLQQKTLTKSMERTGSWLIDPMPPGLILSTFNPTQNWVKKEIYEKHRSGKLVAPYYFLEALPADNPFNTEDQWRGWGNLDSLSYAARIKGNWDAFQSDKPFAYAFKEKDHVAEADFEYSSGHELRLSFDFNKDPITAIASQEVDGEIRIIEEFRLANSDIYELCERITTAFPFALFLVTGDASGRNRSALVQGNINYYTVIQDKLGLSDGQMRQPSINPAVKDSRVLVNSILQNFPIKISPKCVYLVEDLKFVEVDEENDIDKTKDKHRTHILDCFRYLLNTFHADLLNLKYSGE